MLKCPILQQKKNMFTAWWQKVVLVYIANFGLHGNCGGWRLWGWWFFIFFTTHPFKLY